jgi:hypothetical protein
METYSSPGEIDIARDRNLDIIRSRLEGVKTRLVQIEQPGEGAPGRAGFLQGQSPRRRSSRTWTRCRRTRPSGRRASRTVPEGLRADASPVRRGQEALDGDEGCGNSRTRARLAPTGRSARRRISGWRSARDAR